MLGDIIVKNINLSHLGFITFTNVDVAPDLRSAKVFFSILSGKHSDSKIELELNKKRKAFKKFMSPQLSLKYTPDLRFYLDHSLELSEKINKLLKK